MTDKKKTTIASDTVSQEQWYRISESQLKQLEQCGVERCDGGCPDSICPYHIAEEIRAASLCADWKDREDTERRD